MLTWIITKSLIFFQIFPANLAAILTVERLETTVGSLSEIAQQVPQITQLIKIKYE